MGVRSLLRLHQNKTGGDSASPPCHRCALINKSRADFPVNDSQCEIASIT